MDEISEETKVAKRLPEMKGAPRVPNYLKQNPNTKDEEIRRLKEEL